MRYSQDLRARVLGFIAQGGSKAEASRRFQVSQATVFRWLLQPVDYRAQKPGPRTSYKFDRSELAALVAQKPDLTLNERARSFQVSIHAIHHALKRMKIVRKKTLHYAESLRHPEKDKHFIKRKGGFEQNCHELIYVDETGFVPTTYRP